MQKLLYVDSCIRKEQSRTRVLADHFLQHYRDFHPGIVVETVDLTGCTLVPLDCDGMRRRDSLAAQSPGDPALRYARQFASADKIVVAAPFWDLSFPSILRVYVEHICVEGITFHAGQDNRLHGLCAASKLLYITTRGGSYSTGEYAEMEMALPYFRALCRMLGIDELFSLCADGLDLAGNNPAHILVDSLQSAKKLAETF